MTRYLTIMSCYECPYISTNYTVFSSECSLKSLPLPENLEIPVWCPLPEVEKID